MAGVSGEFAALDRLTRTLRRPPPGETWIGDDAAVVHGPDRGWLLLAADAVVEGVHADLTLTGVDDLGWKAVVANISDLAAMGGDPGHALVTIAAPPSADLDGLYLGIAAAAEAYECPVVGGDLTNAPLLVVTVAVTGRVDGAPVLRRGARPGDGIWVTGPLGRAAAGLRLYRRRRDDLGKGRTDVIPDPGPGRLTAAQEADLRRAHARPVPALAEGRAARLGGATAMIDVSDGLAADLAHLARASGVGFALDEVPVAEGATTDEALGGGEDYVLVFTAPDSDRIEDAFGGLAGPVRIGSCTDEPGRWLLAGRPLAPAGWEHRW